MGDDLGTGIQNQNLIGDDVAEEINAALGDQMSGSVTPPTVVKPTHSSPPIPDEPEPASPPADEQPAQDNHDEPAAQDQPAVPDEPAAAEPPALVAATPDFDLPDDQKGSGNTSELFEIKQQALQQLSPLVEHLDQSPEEHFETIIMMLRASDDPALVQPAFDAAQAITDDKQRAQALLDVVNEVNYLTRPGGQ
jgi:hypothetical protein